MTDNKKIKIETASNRKTKMQLELIESIFHSIPCGIVVYTAESHPKVMDYNDTVFKIFGYDSRESFEMALECDFFAMIHGEDVALTGESLKRVMEQSEKISFEHRIVRKDKSVGWVRGTAQCIRDIYPEPVIQSVFLDVTETHEEEKRKHIQNEFLAEIYDTVPCGIMQMTIEEKPKLININDAALKLLGHTREEFLTREWTYYDFIGDKNYQYMDEAMAKPVIEDDGVTIGFEYPLIQKDGRTRWVHDSSKSITNEDNKRVFQSVLVDVTQRKAFEKKVKNDEVLLTGIYDEIRMNTERYEKVLCFSEKEIWDYHIKGHSLCLSKVVDGTLVKKRMTGMPDVLIDEGMIRQEDTEAFRFLFEKIDEGDPVNEWIGYIKNDTAYEKVKLTMMTIYDEDHLPASAIGELKYL